MQMNPLTFFKIPRRRTESQEFATCTIDCIIIMSAQRIEESANNYEYSEFIMWFKKKKELRIFTQLYTMALRESLFQQTFNEYSCTEYHFVIM